MQTYLVTFTSPLTHQTHSLQVQAVSVYHAAAQIEFITDCRPEDIHSLRTVKWYEQPALRDTPGSLRVPAPLGK